MTSNLAVPNASTSRVQHEQSAVAAPIRLLLSVATAAHGLALALTVLLAVLVDRQSDILANKSEAGGGFDPTVFPPYSDGIWVVANGSAVLAATIFVALIALNLALRRRGSR